MQSEGKLKASQSKQSQPEQRLAVEQKPQPSLVLGLQRTGAGEVALLKLNGNEWETIAQDMFAVIEGKIREQLYNEVFLR